jgi:nucleoporin POM152
VKWCEGDVLAPESCAVVETPLPTAEIAWKRIYEWSELRLPLDTNVNALYPSSGDTGISASLVLHGTPPFQVYYRSQADNLSPEEHVKTFASSRGEITLQPTYSGHYVYTFLQISDANYQKVELNGPSIDQVVHPLASAHFTDNSYKYSRTKKKINSCSGNTLDVDVLLRVRVVYLWSLAILNKMFVAHREKNLLIWNCR